MVGPMTAQNTTTKTMIMPVSPTGLARRELHTLPSRAENVLRSLRKTGREALVRVVMAGFVRPRD